jgi:carboxyl-terminal processing protease
MGRVKKLLRRYATLFTVVILSIILASYTFCNRQSRDEFLIDLVTQALDRFHFSPLDINDDFSTKVYNLYLKRLDFSKRFFTKDDLKKLDVYKTKIDDEIKGKSVEFYAVSNEIFYKNVDKVKNYYTEILSQPFTFDGNETFETDPDKSDFPADDAALKESWKKALKYQVMVRLKDLSEVQSQIKSDTIRKKTDAELEVDAREKVKKMHDDWFKRIKQLSENDRFALFLNAITGVYDPHTQYMAPEDKENFDMSMSGQFQGIGAVLQAQDSYVKIASIVPGSPSWLQGELKANDMIMKVAQENQEPVDIFDMPLDEVVKMIRGKKGTKVTLTVKKVDGTLKKITITRDVVIIEETFAKSAMIDDPSGKVGYIYLPKFYQNFEDPEHGRSCADDVAKEVEKLKSEKVNGIVLDLRNNGGGSLHDAIKMGGLFITKGPIVQVKTKTGSPKILDDTDPAIQYGGPLVILTNSFSASASEILAAAMQDYRRAIIVGSNTFGKGTVQNQINLDDVVGPLSQQFGPLGGMLITIQKFYRINGGSTQLKGVTPDVVLPDPFSEIETGEREQEYCMPWTKINPASYSTWTGVPKFEQVVQKENGLVAANTDFKTIKEQAVELKKQHNETLVSLNMDKYKKQEKQTEEKSKRFGELNKKDFGLKIRALQSDDDEMKGDTSKITRSKNWIKELSKDIQLREAVQTVNLINTIK